MPMGLWLLGVMFARQVIADKGVLKEDNQLTENDMPEEVKMVVHTYSNETYVVNGMLEVLQDGNGEQETVMEIQGSIEKVENPKDILSKENFDRAMPTVLTVYEDDKIYGFYSNYEISRENEDSMIYYGFLEGYYDGENYYFT